MMLSCRFRHLAVAGVLGLAIVALGGLNGARAQDDSADDEKSIWNLERRMWNGFIHGLGLRSADDPVIEYRERSPLVVPPSRDLPPPQAKNVAKNPAWPHDPDAARRKAATKKTVGNTDASRAYDRAGNAINPEQLDVPGGTVSTASGPPRGDQSGQGQNLNPSELGYFGGLFTLQGWGFGGNRDEVGKFTKEPTREALTAPPTGYQTPSAEQPYGVTRRIERTAPKAFDPAGY